MEKLLDTLTATGAGHAVVDITGVPAVDTEVAQHLLKTVNAARLLGGAVHHLRPQDIGPATIGRNSSVRCSKQRPPIPS